MKKVIHSNMLQYNIRIALFHRQLLKTLLTAKKQTHLWCYLFQQCYQKKSIISFKFVMTILGSLVLP